MKGCTSPTFATDVLSIGGGNNNGNSNNNVGNGSYCGLFHANNNNTTTNITNITNKSTT